MAAPPKGTRARTVSTPLMLAITDCSTPVALQSPAASVSLHCGVRVTAVPVAATRG